MRVLSSGTGNTTVNGTIFLERFTFEMFNSAGYKLQTMAGLDKGYEKVKIVCISFQQPNLRVCEKDSYGLGGIIGEHEPRLSLSSINDKQQGKTH